MFAPILAQAQNLAQDVHVNESVDLQRSELSANGLLVDVFQYAHCVAILENFNHPKLNQKIKISQTDTFLQRYSRTSNGILSATSQTRSLALSFSKQR